MTTHVHKLCDEWQWKKKKLETKRIQLKRGNFRAATFNAVLMYR